jgi:hypothetical protein
MNVDIATLDTKAIATYTAKAKEQGTIEFLMHVIPSTVVALWLHPRLRPPWSLHSPA